MTLYAIAVETSDLGTFEDGEYRPGRQHKNRCWGAGDCTYLWFHETAAGDYLERLDDNHFMGKQGEPHQLDDAYVETVTPELLAELKADGPVFFPWFAEQAFTDEGYPVQHEYMEEVE